VKLYKLYIFDLDGTLYRGNEAIPNAVEVVNELKRRGAAVRYLTNNSGQTRDFYHSKLNRMGFECEESEIYSSALGAAKVCLDRGYKSVFYVGQPGLAQTLEQAGIVVVNADGRDTEQHAEAVVAGICRSFTYSWLNGALQQIVNGAAFIATNTDATYPIENGKAEPGAGAIIASIKACSGTEPFVVGKPNPFLIDLVIKEAGVAKADVLAVGDRYETDILSGKNAGVDTHLVLTGVTTKAPEGQSWSEDLSGLIR
jgi:HAD superfamily hydrolase (TIGR01457 family)